METLLYCLGNFSVNLKSSANNTFEAAKGLVKRDELLFKGINL